MCILLLIAFRCSALSTCLKKSCTKLNYNENKFMLRFSKSLLVLFLFDLHHHTNSTDCTFIFFLRCNSKANFCCFICIFKILLSCSFKVKCRSRHHRIILSWEVSVCSPTYFSIFFHCSIAKSTAQFSYIKKYIYAGFVDFML